jgi:DNA polymerase III delta subunit
MFCEEDRADVKWACQAALLEMSGSTGPSDELREFILHEATYEQLLNLVYNPHHSSEIYFESEQLEELAQECLLEAAASLVSDNLVLMEADEEKKKKSSKLKTAAKVAGVVGAAGVAGAVAGDVAKTAARARQGKGVAGLAYKAGKKVGKTAYNVGKFPAKGAWKATKWAAKSGAGSGALAGVAAGTGYLLYRKLRKSGKSQSDAAQAAAKASKDPQEKAKWAGKAKQYKSSGK